MHMIILPREHCAKSNSAWDTVHIGASADCRAIARQSGLLGIHMEQRLDKRALLRHPVRLGAHYFVKIETVCSKRLRKLLGDARERFTQWKPDIHHALQLALPAPQNAEGKRQRSAFRLLACKAGRASVRFPMGEKQRNLLQQRQ